MPAESAPDRTRLHITPFTADLYERIVPPSLQPLASNTSFHTVQTFPERGYGFVELPMMEAQKLKKKLHGSTLKGSKMSVEEARPTRKRKSEAEADVGESERKKAKREKKEKKKKEDDGVLAGHELENGRKVKRGWTGQESADVKGAGRKERNSKGAGGVDEAKLRFKAKVPPNKTALPDERDKKKKKEKKAKKEKDKGQVVVEEFTKRRKSRNDGLVVNGHAPGSTSYEEGKGWVDESGNVIEPERKSKRPKKQAPSSPSPPPPQSPSDTGDVSAGAERDPPNGMSEPAPIEASKAESSASPSPSASSSDTSDEKLNDPTPTERPADSTSKVVHPLEALFKRPAAASADTTPTKPRPAPIDTSFSFFGGGGNDAEDDNDEMSSKLPPATPHTKQDLEWRSLRSAAPTPDTAAIGRKFSFPFAGDDEGEDDDEEEVADGAVEEGQGGRSEESAFRRWFFENRGDLNRGWKKRRREERKVVRQRENRRLGRKVA